MHPEGLGDAGAEAISLNQCTNQRADVVNPGSVDEVTEGFHAGLAGAHFEVHEVELIAQVGVGMVQILADAGKSLVEREAGLNADDGEVESVGQAEANAILAIFNHALQDEAREEKAEARDAHQEEKIVEAGKKRNR